VNVQATDFVIIGYLCQNDETREGPPPEHTKYRGSWKRNLIFAERTCSACWPVFRLKSEQPDADG
jgi:hypothetical protein